MNSKPTILVVEDEAIIRLSVVDMMEDAGLSVLEACCAGEAFAIMEAEPNRIDVLLTDIRLGDGPDGWDVAQRARKILGAVPIVFVSGDSAGEWEDRGIERSVMLVKPVPANHLVAAVREGLQGIDDRLVEDRS